MGGIGWVMISFIVSLIGYWKMGCILVIFIVIREICWILNLEMLFFV